MLKSDLFLVFSVIMLLVFFPVGVPMLLFALRARRHERERNGVPMV